MCNWDPRHAVHIPELNMMAKHMYMIVLLLILLLLHVVITCSAGVTLWYAQTAGANGVYMARAGVGFGCLM